MLRVTNYAAVEDYAVRFEAGGLTTTLVSRKL